MRGSVWVRVMTAGAVCGCVCVLLLLAVAAGAQGYVPTAIEYGAVEDEYQGAVIEVVNETDYYQVVGAALLAVLPTALGYRLLANSFRVASET